MDRSQTRLLVVLSVLVVGIGGVLYYQGRQDASSAVDPEATAAVWKLDAKDVVEVRVERASGALALTKDDGVWQVKEPFAGRADEDQVRDLVDSLAEIERGIPVEGATERPDDFGLGDPPNAKVTVKTAAGEQHLDVGVASPVGYRTYVRAADGTVAAVNGDANRTLQMDAAKLRDRRLFRFDAAQVRDVRIVSPGGTLHVNGQGKDWWLDGYGHADPDKVDDLVVGILDLRFDTVLDQAAPIAAPERELTVTFADGTVAGAKTGGNSPIDGGVAVSTLDGRAGTVWPESLKQLDRGPTDVGWRTAFGIRAEEADAVDFTVGGAGGWTVHAVRNGPDWTADGRDPGRVYDGVSALGAVVITYQREAPPPPASAAYTVKVTEGDRSWTLEVGPPGDDGFRSVRDTAGGSPYRIAAAAMDPAFDALSPR